MFLYLDKPNMIDTFHIFNYPKGRQGSFRRIQF